MRSPRPGPVSRGLRTAVGALAFVLAATLAWASTASAEPSSGGATITGSFSDGCRDFTAQATKIGSGQGKDISHVEIRYADGRVVRDETVNSPDYSLDGAAGGEIAFAIVKSGTTSERFDCVEENSPPTALLEVKTPDSCNTWLDGSLACEGRLARTAWSRSTTEPSGLISFFCSWPDDQSCVDAVMPCGQLDGYSLCKFSYSFRGTSSIDPDDDIRTWSLDFGDGTSVDGDWATNPPSEISHEFFTHYCPTCEQGELITLTVTDSAGHSDSDAQFVYHQFPD